LAERRARLTMLEKPGDEAGIARAPEREVLPFSAGGIGAARRPVAAARPVGAQAAATAMRAGQAMTAASGPPTAALPIATTTRRSRRRRAANADDAQPGGDEEAEGGAPGTGVAQAPREVVEAASIHDGSSRSTPVRTAILRPRRARRRA
jgi:hypothetical protein